ncbi:hypothetical protein [Noviherbaspirillum humi]|uniref:hypothetical protein n=1 Tax=Noviherbaspirillum humi TaxID=1688639 RepID=UPI001160C348|nr:hypothetical protein [Noviherbaspirillum humi]
MQRYTSAEAAKLVDELRQARDALASSHHDRQWFRRIHRKITQYALEHDQVEILWSLENQFKAGKISSEEFDSALLQLLTSPNG